MKVLFVTQNIAPFRINWINEMAKYIDIEVVHLNEYEKGFNRKLLADLNEEVKVEDVSKIRFGKYRVFDYKKLKKKEYDVLLLDGYGFVGQMLLLLRLKFKRQKCIMSIDGGILPKKENPLKRWLKKFLLKTPTAFFSTAEETDGFIKHYRKNPLLYRHYFSSVYSKDVVKIEDRVRLHAQYRKEFGFEGKHVVLCVGRFIPVKGFDILLRPLDIFPENYLFVFVGGRPTEEYLHYVGDKLNERVIFVDVVNKETLGKYYLAADVFCLPSRGDVWGLVVGEAMSYGLPVVSSDKCVAALAMVKEENGVIVEGEDPKGYLDAFLKIEDSEIAANMSAQNILRMKEYAIDSAVKQDIENLEEFARKTQGRKE